MTLDELASKCKGAVHVTYNGNRSDYQSVADCLEENFCNRFDDITEEERERIIAADSLVELQFYTDTPVGFYLTFGTTIGECLRGAEAIFAEMERRP